MDTDRLPEEEFESKCVLSEGILQERSDIRVREAEMQYLGSEHGSRLADYLYDSFGGLSNKARCKAVEEYAAITGGLREELASIYMTEAGIERERRLTELNEKIREAYFSVVIKNKEMLEDNLRLNKICSLSRLARLCHTADNDSGKEVLNQDEAEIIEELKKLLND